MRRVAVLILIALSFVWFGACQKIVLSQQIIGRPMVPLNVNAPPTANLYGWYLAQSNSVIGNAGIATNIIDSSSAGNTLNAHGNSVNNRNPRWYTNRINSLPDFKFDNPPDTDTIFVNTSTFTLTGFSFAGVYKFTSNGTYNDLYFFRLRSTDFKMSLQYHHGGGNVILTGTGNNTSVTVTNTLESWQVVTFTWDSTESVPRIKNNTDSVTGTAGTTGNLTSNTVLMQVGATNEFAEFLVYTNKLSAADLTQVRTYLLNKYAITGTP